MQDERVAMHVDLVRAAENGRFDHLSCPGCRQPAVSAWFTHPAEDVYRTWFFCTACKFHTRVIGQKPRYYSEERRRLDLEEPDVAILNALSIKKLPQI